MQIKTRLNISGQICNLHFGRAKVSVLTSRTTLHGEHYGSLFCRLPIHKPLLLGISYPVIGTTGQSTEINKRHSWPQQIVVSPKREREMGPTIPLDADPSLQGGSNLNEAI